jgi:GxxExxY protein
MPIHCPVTIARLSAEDFEKIDYRVMGHAYASQNELGRLCDECAYEADLKARLLADGFRSVQTQVPLTVTHRDLSKTYRLDLIADDTLYDLKAEAALVGEHDAQLLNYMFLLGLGRAKLLNLRPPKVQGKLVATSLTQAERRCFTPVTERWSDLTPACAVLRQMMLDLLQDWGAFLDLALYQEALIHFLGGASNVERRVSLRRNQLELGGQRMLTHAPGVAFRITAFTESQSHIESHLRRLMALTALKAIQWINLNHSRIEFTTIKILSGE